ncbi:MAG: MMPL family transporter [Flavonifractor plautii]
MAAEYYGDDVVLVGNSTNARDLAASFTGDNLKISVLTVLFVVVILLFTFKSAGLPILLVLTIQGSIWINFSFPFLTGTNLFFMSYLIVSAIQMGATIDYAIVITNRYLQLKTVLDRRAAAVEALNQSFPTVLTSGSIMTVAKLSHRQAVHRHHYLLHRRYPGPWHPDLHRPGHDCAAPAPGAGRRPYRAHRHYPQPGPETALPERHHAFGRTRPGPRVRFH